MDVVVDFVNLCGRVLVGLEAVLMDDPVGLAAVGCAAAVEDESLPHPDHGRRGRGRRRGQHRLVPPGGLPEAGGGGAVGARAAWVLAVLVAEEVVLRRRILLLASTNAAAILTALLCNEEFNIHTARSISIYNC